jgi:hypothetical protein
MIGSGGAVPNLTTVPIRRGQHARSRGSDRITAEAEAFVKWHAGQLTWAEATGDDRIQLDGRSWLVRAFPTWNARSMFAHIKPVSRAAVSSATELSGEDRWKRKVTPTKKLGRSRLGRGAFG